MKKLLLIITLFFSWNAIAVEKIWYCTTEKSGGLRYVGGSWKTVTYKPERMTVKQNGVALSFSDMDFERSRKSCEKIHALSDTIECMGWVTTFALNTKTGLATSSNAYGWLSSNGEDGTYDTLSVTLWRCESF